MSNLKKYREIPYNYTSFSDREIILRYFDLSTWEVLNELRNERVTGRSAKLLFEVVGDIFVIDRNPYIFNDFLENPKKQKKLKSVHNRKLSIISLGTQDKRVKDILKKIKQRDLDFFKSFKLTRLREHQILDALSKVTASKNFFFTAFHKVFHGTDATDWRVEFPEAVVYPENAKQVAGIVKKAREVDLKIIPRGGGTGLTGGAVPVFRNTLVVNTEKLNSISEISTVKSGGLDIPVVDVGAGVVTDTVTKYCDINGYVFATDPTSAWASTIGGNIAENCGGKKAVMWGTAIDNLYSFKLVDANGEILEIVRKNHPHRKILHEDTVIYEVFKDGDSNNPVKVIELKGSDIRKKGVGKDITNKALGGVPGIQKEGGDGIIVSAKFVLYRPFTFAKTVCLEFYGKTLENASKAIVSIKDTYGKDDSVFLLALEHFDDKYASAVKYKNKSGRIGLPKAVLLIDLESNQEQQLETACNNLIKMVKPYECEGFLASDNLRREQFWKDRKNLGAIARHTNAFKLNEDVVIPIESLPAFADFIEDLNIEKIRQNDIESIEQLKKSITQIDDSDNYLKERVKRALNLLDQYLNSSTLLDDAHSDFNDLMDLFTGYEEIKVNLEAVLQSVRSKKIIIATHMHAGDGNVHVNIPVHSGDYEMMMDADDTAGRVIVKTTKLDGVISGEHGIGLTKLKFIGSDILKKYADYKKSADPDNLFNPGKLTADFAYSTIYTPSLNLLNKEALIFEATDLKDLTASISACVRCGKCKPNCNTQYPVNNMHYSPRNKILGTSLITEAILYEAQTSRNLTLRNFNMLKEVANHCTMCHNCYAPCPVNIDFGEVTLAIRNLLYDRKRASLKPLTKMTLFYLKKRGYVTNKLFRVGLLQFGYFAQRMAHTAGKPFKPVTRKFTPTISHLLDGRFPKAGSATFRDIFRLKKSDTFYSFANPDKEIKSSVMYFPGCGSERMFSEISIAAIAVLYNRGIRVIVPPDYMCCGYPLVANGQNSKAKTRVYENSVIFHRMAETVSYMNIKYVLVTCGTCHEMLGGYSLGDIFAGSELLDVNEFLVKENLLNANSADKIEESALLYHKPCHTPLKKYGSEKTIKTLLGQNITVVPNCCGEGGTLALSTPDISSSLRNRKERNIIEAKKTSSLRKIEVITTCPSCVQGLSKIDGQIRVSGRSLITIVAKEHFGKQWKRDFIKHVKQKKSIEHIMI